MLRKIRGIVFAYVLVAAGWIFFSDRLLSALVPDSKMLLEWSILKGFVFVFVTAMMLYLLIARLTSKLWNASHSWQLSERKFRTLFEEITDGIAVVDLETSQLSIANEAFSKMLGYSREEIRNLKISDLHPAEVLPRVRAVFKEMGGGANLLTDIAVQRKNGTVFYADINGTGLELDRRPCILGVFRDITEHKRIEIDLKNAKESAEAANHAKDEFIAVISHELRTPLTPALAAIAALSGGEVPPEARRDLEVIRRNLEMESRLIDDLLDLTRMIRGTVEITRETVNVHNCLKGALDLCRSEIELRRLELTQTLEAANAIVCGDSGRLQQVFWSLLKNAIKFTPEGGRLRVCTLNLGDRIRIQISDTGVGIEPETLARLFRPFEQGERTRKRLFGGLGLGLSLAKNLVELHGGQLTATSEGKNKGAVFMVELPLSGTVFNSAPSAMPEAKQSPLLLLVDDHADTLQIFRRLLEKWGYSVVTAMSVQGAIKAAAEHKFDGLVSDLGLPDGSGMEIMKRLKELYGLPGIAMSGFGTEEDFRASRLAGFEKHFVKPVNFSAFRVALDQMLVQSSSA